MERVNQILEQYLCCSINYYQCDRLSLLLLTELNYNSIVYFSLQQTPLHAQYGFHPCDHPATLAAIQDFSPRTPLSSCSVYVCVFQSSWKKQRRISKSIQIDIGSQHRILQLGTVWLLFNVCVWHMFLLNWIIITWPHNKIVTRLVLVVFCSPLPPALQT